MKLVMRSSDTELERLKTEQASVLQAATDSFETIKRQKEKRLAEVIASSDVRESTIRQEAKKERENLLAQMQGLEQQHTVAITTLKDDFSGALQAQKSKLADKLREQRKHFHNVMEDLNVAAALAQNQVIAEEKRELEAQYRKIIAAERANLQKKLAEVQSAAKERERKLEQHFQQSTACLAVEHQSEVEALKNASNLSAQQFSQTLDSMRQEAEAEIVSSREACAKRIHLVEEQLALMVDRVEVVKSEAANALQEAVREARDAALLEAAQERQTLLDVNKTVVAQAVKDAEIQMLDRFTLEKEQLFLAHEQVVAAIRVDAEQTQQKEQDSMQMVGSIYTLCSSIFFFLIECHLKS